MLNAHRKGGVEELDFGESRPTRACMERRTLVRADVGWTLNDNDDDDDDN